MWPLLACSLAAWAVIFERLWSYRKLGNSLHSFYLESLNYMLRDDREGLKRFCEQHSDLPTSKLIRVALDRLSSKDQRIRSRWIEALERSRQSINQELRRGLWVLGTIGSASPFIGLFGTVVGILRSFQEMAKTGSGGFAVVAAGISESLIATAAGIVVGIVSVMAFNAFQSRWGALVLTIKLQTEEFAELLDGPESPGKSGDGV